MVAPGQDFYRDIRKRATDELLKLIMCIHENGPVTPLRASVLTDMPLATCQRRLRNSAAVASNHNRLSLFSCLDHSRYGLTARGQEVARTGRIE